MLVETCLSSTAMEQLLLYSLCLAALSLMRRRIMEILHPSCITIPHVHMHMETTLLAEAAAMV